MSKRQGKTNPAAGFQPGDRVRVRHGVTDVDYPDLPMGGWAGTIIEIHDDGMYTVTWSKETLAAIHPVFKTRCDNDGMDVETYWLGAQNLEPDIGGPLEIEQPTAITPKPLSPADHDDRIRMVLGLTSDDLLPDVDDETLKVYHDYLSKRLVFPFRAKIAAEQFKRARVDVIGLGDPDDDPMIDDSHGILCEARHEGQIVTLPLGELEDVTGEPNRQLIDDYRYWFWNWR
jgi:hypothetical protein